MNIKDYFTFNKDNDFFIDFSKYEKKAWAEDIILYKLKANEKYYKRRKKYYDIVITKELRTTEDIELEEKEKTEAEEKGLKKYLVVFPLYNEPIMFEGVENTNKLKKNRDRFIQNMFETNKLIRFIKYREKNIDILLELKPLFKTYENMLNYMDKIGGEEEGNQLDSSYLGYKKFLKNPSLKDYIMFFQNEKKEKHNCKRLHCIHRATLDFPYLNFEISGQNNPDFGFKLFLENLSYKDYKKYTQYLIKTKHLEKSLPNYKNDNIVGFIGTMKFILKEDQFYEVYIKMLYKELMNRDFFFFTHIDYLMKIF
jgi:hypothetical protein